MLSMANLTRGAVVLGVSVCVAAVALGHMCAPDPTLRSLNGTQHVSLAPLASANGDHRLSFIDLNTGMDHAIPMADGECLDQASCSPWTEESGSAQVVGFWSRRSGKGVDGLASEIGLARLRFPDGEVLDRVATDVTPVGPPCWYPGTQAKVLFADGGGTLWQFAFEGSARRDANLEGRDLRPSPIVWKTTPPGEAERSIRMFDPTWPEGRALAGKLIVSLSLQVRGEHGPRYTPMQLWWLCLDAEGEAIIAAGPLTRHDEASEVKERCPRVLKTPDGQYQITYLERRGDAASWSLAVAPLEFTDEGLPTSSPASRVMLGEQPGLAAPAFSTDGRWVYFLAPPYESGIARRVAVPPLGREPGEDDPSRVDLAQASRTSPPRDGSLVDGGAQPIR